MKSDVVHASESADSQIALCPRISGIVSSSLMLDQMIEALIGLVVGVTSCDACLVYHRSVCGRNRAVRKTVTVEPPAASEPTLEEF